MDYNEDNRQYISETEYIDRSVEYLKNEFVIIENASANIYIPLPSKTSNTTACINTKIQMISVSYITICYTSGIASLIRKLNTVNDCMGEKPLFMIIK